jgi:hypothetical protein
VRSHRAIRPDAGRAGSGGLDCRHHQIGGKSQKNGCRLTLFPSRSLLLSGTDHWAGCGTQESYRGFGETLLSNSVAAPIFAVTTAEGTKTCGLFGVLAAAARGELVDMPSMAAHQRAPVVTLLAILMHVLSRYGKVDRASESAWARAWNKLIGPDALRLTAHYNEVAFLQPPTKKPTSQQAIEAADLLLPNVEHEVKRTWSTARAERAFFSLIGSLSRPNVKDHRSSTRTGLCAILPSVDGTLGSEICSVLAAYDQLNPSTGNSTKAADHFVWLKPYRPRRTAQDLSRASRVRSLTLVARKE